VSLPEIPAAAVSAIRLDLPWLSEHDADAAAHTAWPHLYAAALRHALLALPTAQEIVLRHNVSPSAGGGNFVAVLRRELARLADEADPQP
jgi:prephenate dehydrogenase